MIDDEMIETLLQSPDPASLEWARDPEFFAPFLQHSLAVVDSNPKAGEPYARIACKIAPTNCDRVQAMGLYAQVERSTGRTAAALARIGSAFIFGEDCSACLADLRRRRSIVKASLRDFPGAFADIDEAIDEYSRLGGPGHDLDGNGLASSYYGRGNILLFAGRASEAVDDTSTCLSLIDPKISPALYRAAVFNLAAALAFTGRREDLERAAEHLVTARRLFSGVTQPSQERAKLEWLTAMVYRELGDGRRGRPSTVREMLTRARRDFISLGFVQEGAAISADMMRAAFPDRDRIREAIAGLEKRYERASLVVPAVIMNALEHVKTAVDSYDHRAVETLQAAVEGLRAACGDKMLACLVTWRSLRW